MASCTVATVKFMLAVNRTVKLHLEFRMSECTHCMGLPVDWAQNTNLLTYVHDLEARVTSLLPDAREIRTAIDIAIGSHVQVIHTVCGATV